MNKANMIWFIVAIAAIVLVSKPELLSVAPPGSVTWNFKHGCSNGDCTSSSYNIGKLQLLSGAPIYLNNTKKCQFSPRSSGKADWVSYPAPYPECWAFNATYTDPYSKKPQTKILKLKAEVVYKINKYLQTSWKPSGIIFNGMVCHTIDEEEICKDVRYGYDWQDPEWTADYTFSFYDMSFFLTDIKDKHITDTVTQFSYLTYEVYNNLTELNGGIVVKEKNDLWSPADFQKEEQLPIVYGKKTYATTLSSATLGDKVVEVTPYINIYQMIMGQSSAIKVYSNTDEKDLRVLPNIENIPEQDKDFWNRNPTAEEKSLAIPAQSSGLFNINTITICILLIIGGIIYYAKKSK